MATSYPGALDAFSNPAASDNLDSVAVPHASQHTNLNDAVEAIEAELGTDPAGASATVKARFEALDTLVAGKAPTAWVAKSSGYTAVPGDHIIDVTGATTIVLPAAASNTGKVFVIRNTGGAAVTIDGNASELVGGAATQSFTGYGYLRIVSNGSGWLVLDGQYWDESVGRRQFAWDMVNSRWQMVYGDTGWRTLTPLNSWAYAGSANPNLRRVGNVCEFFGYLNAAAASSSVVVTVPTGFRPTQFQTAVGMWSLTDLGTPGSGVARIDTDDWSLNITNRGGNTNILVDMKWTTIEAWPTSLPGVALWSIPSA